MLEQMSLFIIAAEFMCQFSTAWADVCSAWNRWNSTKNQQRQRQMFVMCCLQRRCACSFKRLTSLSMFKKWVYTIAVAYVRERALKFPNTTFIIRHFHYYTSGRSPRGLVPTLGCIEPFHLVWNQNSRKQYKKISRCFGSLVSVSVLLLYSMCVLNVLTALWMCLIFSLRSLLKTISGRLAHTLAYLLNECSTACCLIFSLSPRQRKAPVGQHHHLRGILGRLQYILGAEEG